MTHDITKLINVKDLQPRPELNSLFGELVSYVLSFSHLSEMDAETLLRNYYESNQIAQLQQICGQGEALLELTWAEQIINGGCELVDFPYHQNYLDLTALEANLISQEQRNWAEQPVLFVGGGALPMTAIMLAYYYGVRSTILEIDRHTANQAQKLLQHIGLADMISVIHADGAEFKHYSNFPTIYVAALAGLGDEAKQDIFTNIADQIKPDQLLVARSSWGMRQLLYRPLPNLAKFGINTITTHHPRTSVVNSVVLLRKNDQLQNF